VDAPTTANYHPAAAKMKLSDAIRKEKVAF
jgi:hypothetical protein